MAQTTVIKKRADQPVGPIDKCHDGVGAVDWTGVLNPEDLKGQHLSFIHDDVLKPGVSVGVHGHDDVEEYYYILSGHGVMTLDDTRYEVGPGDVTGVFRGGVHGLENTGTEDMRVVVVCVS
jgi:uncharacterized cupin superfamily protein